MDLHPNTTPGEREKMLADYRKECPLPDDHTLREIHNGIAVLIAEGRAAYVGNGTVQLTVFGNANLDAGQPTRH